MITVVYAYVRTSIVNYRIEAVIINKVVHAPDTSES